MLSVLFAESGDNLSRLLEFYAPSASRVLDVTYGGGTLTKRARIRVVGIDKDPTTRPAVRADSRALPFTSGSFDVAVYDPPYLYGTPALHMGPIGKKTWNNTRSTWKGPEQLIHTSEGIARELARVLTAQGVVICKIMDSRFRGRLVRNHDLVADAFERHGFVLRDQVVYIRTVTGSYVNTKSAQSTHGYFLMFGRTRQRALAFREASA
jgi:hypothetical protein